MTPKPRGYVVGVCLVFLVASCKDTGPDPGGPDAPPADAAPPARLTIDRPSIQFGSVTVATRSPEVSVIILNRGGSDSGMISAVASGTDPTQFVVTNGCTYLGAGGQCVVTARFTPTSAGVKSAILVMSAMPGGTLMTTLDGQGTP